MLLKASATCKSIAERESLLDRIRLLGIRPSISGLTVTIEYQVEEGSWPFYVTSLMTMIFAAFEEISEHSVDFIS